MKKISGILLVLLFFTTGNLFASLNILLTKPTVVTGVYDGISSDVIQLAIDNGIVLFQSQIDNSDLTKLREQDKMATSFADAAGYAANAGSLDGYQGYDLFAVMAGVSAGIQLPSISINLQKMINDVQDELVENKDASVGAGVSSSISLGLNITPVKNFFGLRRVLRNRMYMNVKYLTLSRDIQDFSFDTTTYGIGINYQLIDRGGKNFKPFKWSGVSIGTGFIHSADKITMKTQFNEYLSDPLEAGGKYVKMGFTPDMTFDIDTTSNVIPLDISTSLRILWLFNFTLGAGVDFTYGRTKIALHAVSDMNASICDTADGTYIPIDTVPGSGVAVVDAGTNGKPALTNYRLTAGVGICLGPLPVDLKVSYYPVDSGLSANVSTGIVW